MKIRRGLSTICAALAAVQAAAVAAEPATYAIDPSHTKVYWETRHFGTSTHRGSVVLAEVPTRQRTR